MPWTDHKMSPFKRGLNKTTKSSLSRSARSRCWKSDHKMRSFRWGLNKTTKSPLSRSAVSWQWDRLEGPLKRDLIKQQRLDFHLLSVKGLWAGVTWDTIVLTLWSCEVSCRRGLKRQTVQVEDLARCRRGKHQTGKHQDYLLHEEALELSIYPETSVCDLA